MGRKANFGAGIFSFALCTDQCNGPCPAEVLGRESWARLFLAPSPPELVHTSVSFGSLEEPTSFGPLWILPIERGR